MKNILLKAGEDVPSSATLNYPSGEYLFYEYTEDTWKQQVEFQVSDDSYINGPGYYAFRGIWSNCVGRYENLNNETNTADRIYNGNRNTVSEIYLGDDGWYYRTRPGCPIDWYDVNRYRNYGTPRPTTSEIFPGVAYYRDQNMVLYNPKFPMIYLTTSHTWTWEELGQEFGFEMNDELYMKYSKAIREKKLIGPDFNVYFSIKDGVFSYGGFSLSRVLRNDEIEFYLDTPRASGALAGWVFSVYSNGTAKCKFVEIVG